MKYKNYFLPLLISSISLSIPVCASENSLVSGNQVRNLSANAAAAELSFVRTGTSISQPDFNSIPRIIEEATMGGPVSHIRIKVLPGSSTEEYTNNIQSRHNTSLYDFTNASVYTQDSTNHKGRRNGGFRVGGINVGFSSGGGSSSHHSHSALNIHEHSEEQQHYYENNPHCLRAIQQPGLEIEIEYQDRNTSLELSYQEVSQTNQPRVRRYAHLPSIFCEED
jgi:hypothetical protein